MNITSAKWNTQPEELKVWQVAREIGRFKNEISLDVVSAGVKPPNVGESLAMENPAAPGTVGHVFKVIDVQAMDGHHWVLGLRLVMHPGFIVLPVRVTPLAYHEPFKTGLHHVEK